MFISIFDVVLGLVQFGQIFMKKMTLNCFVSHDLSRLKAITILLSLVDLE